MNKIGKNEFIAIILASACGKFKGLSIDVRITAQ